MTSSDEVRREFVDGWLRLAELDFQVAEDLLDDGPRHPLAIAFHSQQAVEKYLKAMLVDKQVEFPKTHDMRRLLELVGRVDAELASRLDPVEVLSRYAVASRYPGDIAVPSATEAAEAVKLARLTRDEIRRHLST